MYAVCPPFCYSKLRRQSIERTPWNELAKHCDPFYEELRLPAQFPLDLQC